jgi:hypothetical protein
MKRTSKTAGALIAVAAIWTLGACSSDKTSPGSSGSRFVLGSVVIDADGKRTTYVQTLDSLDAGPFTNESAIELPGNGVLMAHAGDFFVGLAEEPTWVRYSVAEDGVRQTGRISFLDYGPPAIDYGNAIVDDETAVSVFSDPALAVVWNPKTMAIVGTVELAELARDGYTLEVWTTIAHNGLVYIPGRWSDWEGSRIFPEVSLTILDPKKLSVVATARDQRCASGGRVVFDKAGYAYVMGDGRNYSMQMFANAGGTTAPKNCLLRIAPGAVEFEKGYFYEIASLTGGLESITELDTAEQGSGIGFAKVFYPNQLPDGVTATDFEFWDVPAHKLWRLSLADPPSAEAVQGIPFSTIGFEGSVLGRRLYTGESTDGGNTSEVYETDPAANTAVRRFKMDGYFDGLYELAK